VITTAIIMVLVVNARSRLETISTPFCGYRNFFHCPYECSSDLPGLRQSMLQYTPKGAGDCTLSGNLDQCKLRKFESHSSSVQQSAVSNQPKLT